MLSEVEQSIPIDEPFTDFYRSSLGTPYAFGLTSDWMIVGLEGLEKSDLIEDTQGLGNRKQFLTNSFQLANGTSCAPQSIATEPRDTDIVIFTPSSSIPLKAKLSGAPCLWKAQDCNKFQEYWNCNFS